MNTNYFFVEKREATETHNRFEVLTMDVIHRPRQLNGATRDDDCHRNRGGKKMKVSGGSSRGASTRKWNVARRKIRQASWFRRESTCNSAINTAVGCLSKLITGRLLPIAGRHFHSVSHF